MDSRKGKCKARNVHGFYGDKMTTKYQTDPKTDLQTANQIGITVKELIDYSKDNLIAKCKTCGIIELFHKAKRGGKYRQSACIKCRKKVRK